MKKQETQFKKQLRRFLAATIIVLMAIGLWYWLSVKWILQKTIPIEERMPWVFEAIALNHRCDRLVFATKDYIYLFDLNSMAVIWKTHINSSNLYCYAARFSDDEQFVQFKYRLMVKPNDFIVQNYHISDGNTFSINHIDAWTDYDCCYCNGPNCRSVVPPNGTEAVYSNRFDKYIYFVEINKHTGIETQLYSFDVGEPTFAVRYSFNGKMLAVLCKNKIQIWRRM